MSALLDSSSSSITPHDPSGQFGHCEHSQSAVTTIIAGAPSPLDGGVYAEQSGVQSIQTVVFAPAARPDTPVQPILTPSAVKHTSKAPALSAPMFSITAHISLGSFTKISSTTLPHPGLMFTSVVIRSEFSCGPPSDSNIRKAFAASIESPSSPNLSVLS